MCVLHTHICALAEAFLFLLYNRFTVTHLTREKVCVYQPSMWFQYEDRMQLLGQGWTASI